MKLQPFDFRQRAAGHFWKVAAIADGSAEQ
jgi:hypothetical protein